MSDKSLPPKQYVRLGRTGPWIKDEEESIVSIKKAYELGINVFDTGARYSNGENDRVLGKALKKTGAVASHVVIAIKAFSPVFDDVARVEMLGLDTMPKIVNRYGLSRKHIFDAVDASFEQIGVDYIDLYQIHCLDLNTPKKEIMEALNDSVKSL